MWINKHFYITFLYSWKAKAVLCIHCSVNTVKKRFYTTCSRIAHLDSGIGYVRSSTGLLSRKFKVIITDLVLWTIIRRTYADPRWVPLFTLFTRQFIDFDILIFWHNDTWQTLIFTLRNSTPQLLFWQMFSDDSSVSSTKRVSFNR